MSSLTAGLVSSLTAGLVSALTAGLVSALTAGPVPPRARCRRGLGAAAGSVPPRARCRRGLTGPCLRPFPGWFWSVKWDIGVTWAQFMRELGVDVWER